MSQNVTIAGASYSDVPSINIPKTGGGTSSFYDISDSTVSAEDMLSGVTAYDSSGEKISGEIESKTSLDLTASGDTVNVPSGYYANNSSKSVSSGSSTAPATISGSSATVTVGTNTLTFSKTISVTPLVTAGYISSGTAGNSAVSLTASITTSTDSGNTTLTSSTTSKSYAAGYYSNAHGATVTVYDGSVT